MGAKEPLRNSEKRKLCRPYPRLDKKIIKSIERIEAA